MEQLLGGIDRADLARTQAAIDVHQAAFLALDLVAAAGAAGAVVAAVALHGRFELFVVAQKLTNLLVAAIAQMCIRDRGYTWQVALLAVFVEGLIFVVLSLTNVREAIFNAIPLTLKRGVSVGIGLFICFIGLQNAGLAVDSATLVTITSFTENFNTCLLYTSRCV